MSLIVKDADKLAIRELASSDVLMKASEAVAEIGPSFAVKSDEEAAAAGDIRLLAKRGIRTISEGLTALFAPGKAVEKVVREHFKRPAQQLEAAVTHLDRALLAWDSEKKRKVEEERRAAQAAVEAAAAEARREAEQRAAAAEAASPDSAVAVDLDEPPPGVAQVMVPAPTRVVRSASSTTYTTSTTKAEVVDMARAMQAWPEAFEFSERAALSALKARAERGQASVPTEAGIEVGGIRFYIDKGIAGRSR